METVNVCRDFLFSLCVRGEELSSSSIGKKSFLTQEEEEEELVKKEELILAASRKKVIIIVKRVRAKGTTGIRVLPVNSSLSV